MPSRYLSWHWHSHAHKHTTLLSRIIFKCRYGELWWIKGGTIWFSASTVKIYEVLNSIPRKDKYPHLCQVPSLCKCSLKKLIFSISGSHFCEQVECLLMVYNIRKTALSWKWTVFPSADRPHWRGAEVSGRCVWRHLQSQVSHRWLHCITHTQWRRKSQQRLQARGPGSFSNQKWVLNLHLLLFLFISFLRIW